MCKVYDLKGVFRIFPLIFLGGIERMIFYDPIRKILFNELIKA